MYIDNISMDNMTNFIQNVSGQWFSFIFTQSLTHI